jgi:hypothetical protein
MTIIQTLITAVPSHIFRIILWSVRSYYINLFHAERMFSMINSFNLFSFNFFIFSRIYSLFDTCRFTSIYTRSHILSHIMTLSQLNIEISLILRFLRFRCALFHFRGSSHNLCSWQRTLICFALWTSTI